MHGGAQARNRPSTNEMQIKPLAQSALVEQP
jgi:hypothetical protein